jgi:porin
MFIACAGLLRANDCDPCEAVDTCSSNGNGKAIEMEFTYTGGVFGNVRGGDRRGSTYMGLAELGFTGDSEKLGLWKNGTFFVSGFFSHGPGMTRFVGDYQDPVNFAYEVPAQLCEYWYKHLFFQDRLSVRAGKADSSSTFFFLDSQDYFINSGFTNLNTPHIPADPENAWGIVSELQLQRDAVLKFGIHDEDVDANRYDFPTFKKPCYVVQLEKRYSLFGNLPGFAFIGGWYDTEELVQYFTDEDIKGNYGFSAGVDQMIWRKYPNKRNGNTQGINFFLRYQADKKDRNETYRNVDYGLAYRGFFDSRPDDVVGIGSSMVRFSPGYQEYANDGDGIPYSSETALECFYRMQVTERLMVQPDFQYIWRPGGEFPHATVLGLAFQVAF